MGTSDYRSILGNRRGLQQGWNFDNCERIDPENTDRLPQTTYDNRRQDIVDLDVPKEFRDIIYEDSDGEVIDIENSELIIEFMLCEVKTNYNGCYSFCDEKTLRRFERKFMKEVYPHHIATKLGDSMAHCHEWNFEINTPNVSIVDSMNVWVVPYIRAHPGIFKFDDYLFDEHDKGDEYLTKSMIFNNYDQDIHEIWCRVMYKQVFEGLVKEDISKISDECLVHVASELEIIDPEECSIQDLYDECVKIIKRRYYPKK